MPSLSIKIHRCNESEPAWPEQAGKIEKELEPTHATIIEQGMASGEIAVALTLTDPSTGQMYFAQTSAAILKSLVAAIVGAEARFAEHPVPNIWKEKSRGS